MCGALMDVYVQVRVCTSSQICTYLFMHMIVHTQINIHTHTHSHTYTRTCIHTHACAHTRTHTHAHRVTYMHTTRRTHALSLSHTHTHTYKYTQSHSPAYLPTHTFFSFAEKRAALHLFTSFSVHFDFFKRKPWWLTSYMWESPSYQNGWHPECTTAGSSAPVGDSECGVWDVQERNTRRHDTRRHSRTRPHTPVCNQHTQQPHTPHTPHTITHNSTFSL